MPRYEYKCSQCDLIKEEVHLVAESPQFFCDQCNHQLHRIISRNVAVSFRGCGFYVTDSAQSQSSSKSETTSDLKSSS